MTKWYMIMLLLLSTSSCRSPDVVPATRSMHDTLYLWHEKYDSICLSEISHERYRPSSFHYDTLAQSYLRIDTFYKETAKTEFRYKLLHDTTFIHKVDTIPKVITITEAKSEVPKLCWVLPLFILLLFCGSFQAKQIKEHFAVNLRHPQC